MSTYSLSVSLFHEEKVNQSIMHLPFPSTMLFFHTSLLQIGNRRRSHDEEDRREGGIAVLFPLDVRLCLCLDKGTQAGRITARNIIGCKLLQRRIKKESRKNRRRRILFFLSLSFFFFCVSPLVDVVIGPLTEISGLLSQFVLFLSAVFLDMFVLIGLVSWAKGKAKKERDGRKEFELFSCSPNYHQISFSRFSAFSSSVFLSVCLSVCVSLSLARSFALISFLFMNVNKLIIN